MLVELKEDWIHHEFSLFILADNAGHTRSSQALLDDEWEPEPIEALTGELIVIDTCIFYGDELF